MIKNKKQNKFKILYLDLLSKLKCNTKITVAISISFFVLALLAYLNSFENSGFSKFDISEFEIGMVADRDVISNRRIEYIDEKATEIRKVAAKHSVRPIFLRDNVVAIKSIKMCSEFIAFITEKKNNTKNFNTFKFAVLEKYPTLLTEKNLEEIYNSKEFYEITALSITLLKQALDLGIVEMPVNGLEGLHDSEIIILTNQNDRQTYETTTVTKLILYEEFNKYIKKMLISIKKSDFEKHILNIIQPFTTINIIFDSDETEKRTLEAIKNIQPIKITINNNQKIIKRGFTINEEAYNQLKIYSTSGKSVDFRHFFGSLLFLVISLFSGLFLFSKKILGTALKFEFNLLVLISFDIIYILFLFTSHLSIFSLPLNIMPIVPVAFFTMLAAALISQKIAVYISFILSLAVLGGCGYKIQPALFAVFSGLTANALIHITGKRMELIKTSCMLAIIQPLIAMVIMLIFPETSSANKTVLFIAISANGFMSGIFVLGFLPILETFLNTPTSFRLMEFSDLNSPIMKKMLLTVSGTYNHSMMVATLAESACREIGADPLLARVGGYYHDIGKMDQGEYFVENQTTYNKHLDLNPRLSATVIRSHVKLGVEKARQLRLPQAVIDIIAEHHGNSFIAYFYAKAKETNPDTDPEDFSYPGTPPRSKESAVVMLADTVEAACRTLEKRTVPRLEKFINELVSDKIKAGQLDNSDLTFKDITIIKQAFVNILAGYYHSRIEYPNQKTNDDTEKKSLNKNVTQKNNIEISPNSKGTENA